MKLSDAIAVNQNTSFKAWRENARKAATDIASAEQLDRAKVVAVMRGDLAALAGELAANKPTK